MDREQQRAELYKDGWRDWSPEAYRAISVESRMFVIGWSPVRDLMDLDALGADESDRLLEMLMELKVLRMELTRVS